jgi:hypothetical protein
MLAQSLPDKRSALRLASLASRRFASEPNLVARSARDTSTLRVGPNLVALRSRPRVISSRSRATPRRFASDLTAHPGMPGSRIVVNVLGTRARRERTQSIATACRDRGSKFWMGTRPESSAHPLGGTRRAWDRAQDLLENPWHKIIDAVARSRSRARVRSSLIEPGRYGQSRIGALLVRRD